jgi:ElaB/YqjD/DUF883 family membrane-anchored ribosome-binding protein
VRRCSPLSNDHLATLSADLNALVRSFSEGSGQKAERHRQRIETAGAEVRRHLERASAFIGHMERNKP